MTREILTKPERLLQTYARYTSAFRMMRMILYETKVMVEALRGAKSGSVW
jgi:hypothetical protein